MQSIEKQIRALFFAETHKLTPLATQRNHTLAVVGKPEHPKPITISDAPRIFVRRKRKENPNVVL
jgi:hypothetical protein